MKVFIQQPVIPAYREEYFLRLAQLEGVELHLHASKQVPGCPPSNKDTFGFAHTWHECRSFFGDRLFWQKGMKIPADMRAGDVVVYNSNPRFISNLGLIRKAKKRGIKVISWNHAMSSSSGELSSRLRKKITDKDADLMLFYTDGEVELMKREGYPAERLHALNNTLNPKPMLAACRKWQDGRSEQEAARGVDLQESISSDESADSKRKRGEELISLLRTKGSAKLNEFCREHEIEGEQLLLFCGRVTGKTCLHLIIKALKSLPENTLLVIIGDGEMKGQWQQLSRELGVQDKIRWLGAIYDEEKLASWFLSACLFVYPGAVGLSVNHAMLYGLPVITHDTAADHMPEFHYLTQGKNALLCRKDDSDSLAECLNSALRDTGTMQRLSDGALESAWQEFTFDKMVQRFAQALQLVSGKPISTNPQD